MFALGLHYLNGWSMAAADGARKERAEWPPHPDRVFMALAAAWFETGEDPAEGAALRWLEALPPPAIAASEAASRASTVSYVPVNDVLTQRPEYRSRQPRRFPVVIPDDPTVHLIWLEAELGAHRTGLEQLAAKVTHVGHSASFVQAWLEVKPPLPNWVPANGVARQRLRVTSPGRLENLAVRMNRDALIAYSGLRDEIEQANADLKEMNHPPRSAWQTFPSVVLLAGESDVKQHSEYAAAKSGNALAATNLVTSLVNEEGVAAVRSLIAKASQSRGPILVSAHAYECEGVNAIPTVLARSLSARIGTLDEVTVVQANVVSHTGADGYGRLARQACFDGRVDKGREYVMVDDFIGQGGTLANLRGWIEKQGGKVIGAVVLTGKPYSARLNPSQEQLDELRQRHGKDFERWWREHFGHSFDCLTQSEARYLARSPDVDTIRNRLAAAKQEGNRPGRTRSPREQKRYIADLKARLPKSPPAPSLRPAPGRWQGYDPPPAGDTPKERGSIFDPQFIVLGVSGNRVSLPATLKLTTALRGLLMKECPQQPPPEWFSGHRPDGKATSEPHLALAPLPFVGSEHADGRILGVAVVLPAKLERQEAERCLEPLLRDSLTGLPCEHRLFGGRWLDIGIDLETRERPPMNLNLYTWTRPSRVWATVTPVVLNRHFDGADKWERAAESVKDACLHIGLPRPREVFLHPVSLVEGVPHARDFPQVEHKNAGGRRSHGHAVIVFDEPVRGPVLVGAGRFRGYGLCRPMDERSDDRD